MAELTQQDFDRVANERAARDQARIESQPLSEVKTTNINSWGDVTSVQATSPLAKLETNKYAYTALQYPADAGSYAKGHTVIFNISDIEPASVEKLEKFMGGAFAEAGKTTTSVYNSYQSGNLAEDTLNKAKEFATEQYNNLKQAAEEVGKNGVFATLDSGLKKVESFFKPQYTNSVAGIRLCMPDTVNFQYAVQYDKLSLANAYGAVPLAGTIVKAVTSTLENNAAAKMLMNANGMAFNPQMQVLFEGIDFRDYEMTFVFTPNNSREAESVKQIIKTFRKYAAPTVMKQTGGFFFNPPSVVDVQFMFNGRPNPYLNEIRRSVITQVSVDYSPNQTWATFNNGAPVQTSMTLTFREIYLVDRDSIDKEA